MNDVAVFFLDNCKYNVSYRMIQLDEVSLKFGELHAHDYYFLKYQECEQEFKVQRK